MWYTNVIYTPTTTPLQENNKDVNQTVMTEETFNALCDDYINFKINKRYYKPK